MVKKAISRRRAEFIDTMDCLPVTKLPEGPEWTYELKLDGYRLEAVRVEKLVITETSSGRLMHLDGW